MFGCESCILKKTLARISAFEMKGLRQILTVARTEKRTNKWVLQKAELKRDLLEAVKKNYHIFRHVWRRSSSKEQYHDREEQETENVILGHC